MAYMTKTMKNKQRKMKSAFDDMVNTKAAEIYEAEVDKRTLRWKQKIKDAATQSLDRILEKERREIEADVLANRRNVIRSTSLVTSEEVARRMKSNLGTSEIFDPLSFIYNDPEKTSFLKGDSSINDRYATYYVTIKNLSTGEEYMHTEPVGTDDLENWLLLFIHHPICSDINMAKEQEFPKLRKPGISELWKKTHMKVNGEKWEMVVTLARQASSLSETPDFTTDCVVFYLKSPKLPLTFQTYSTKFNHMHSRKECQLQFGMLALAQKLLKDAGLTELKRNNTSMNITQKNAVVATIIHGDSIYSRRDIAGSVFYGAFASNVQEPTCGSAVLPQLFKYLHFLLPILQPNELIRYNIASPHRYGYALHIPNLAGWSVAASVNMLGCPSAIEGAFPNAGEYDEQDDNDTRQRAPYLFAFMQNTVSVEEIEVFQTELNQANIDAQIEYEKAYSKHKADTSTTNLQKKLLQKLEDVSSGKIDISNSATEEQMQAMSDSMWEALMKYSGIWTIQNRINDILEPLKTAQAIQKGIDFINLWSKKDEANQNDIDVFTSVLYQICLGLAEATIAQIKTKLQNKHKKEEATNAYNAEEQRMKAIMDPSNATVRLHSDHEVFTEAMKIYRSIYASAELNKAELPKKLIEELRTLTQVPLKLGDREKMHLEYGKVLSFMQTTCSGSPPYKWYNMAKQSLLKDPITLCKILFREPSILLKHYIPPPFLKRSILDINISSIYSNRMIMKSYSIYHKLIDKLQTDITEYSSALAYALFTDDDDKGLRSNWKTS